MNIAKLIRSRFGKYFRLILDYALIVVGIVADFENADPQTKREIAAAKLKEIFKVKEISVPDSVINLAVEIAVQMHKEKK